MPETLFGTLLLSVTGVISVQAHECIVGATGERVILPCVYNGVTNLTSLNISSERKRGMEIMNTTIWMEGQMPNVLLKIQTNVSSLAPFTGDFSMEFDDVHLSDRHNYSFYLKLHDQKSSSVCLTVAGHFSHPTLVRENEVNGDKSTLFCNSEGGFPAPPIYWLVNHTHRPPDSSVTTYIHTLPESGLYNITSVLSISISTDTAVSCVIENKMLNETLTTTDFGVQSRISVRRLSEHIWPLTAALCVVVLILVATSLAFQKKWDRDRLRKQHRYGDVTGCECTDMIVFDMERWASLPGTDV